MKAKSVNKKEAALARLIKKAGLDNPSPDFTAVIMGEIMAENGVAINPALKSVLERNGIEEPTIRFTDEVMARVHSGEFGLNHKPIIPKKAWVAVTAVVASFIAFVGYTEQGPAGSSPVTSFLTGIGNMLNTLFIGMNSVPFVYRITFISLSLLLVSDYLLRTKDQFHKRRSKLIPPA